MNVTQNLAEMRALGHRFYVVQTRSNKGKGILQLFPDNPPSRETQAHMLELEAWRKANTTSKDLVKAILADQFKPTAQSKEKSHV